LDKHLAVIARDLGRRSSTTNTATESSNIPPAHALIRNLEDSFLPKGNSLPAQSRKVVRQDIDRLATDLMLSATIHASDPIEPLSQGDDVPAEESPDDLFARTELLSLNDKDSGPPPVKLSYLIPRNVIDLAHAEGEQNSTEEVIGPNNLDALQRSNVRSLMAEWEIGSDPAAYTWKSWASDTTGVRTTTASPQRTNRLIRPLPGSPRSSQVFQTQLATQSLPLVQSSVQSRYAPPSVQSQIQSHTLNVAQTSPRIRQDYSMPTLGSGGRLPTMRSSPPPAMAGSSQIQSDSQHDYGMASTQVERGPFGGRPEKAKKKPGKKRVGGF
jgi:hypothetical protein